MQLTLLHCEQRESIAGQPIRETYLHDRLPYTIKVIDGPYAGDSLVYLLHFERAYHHCRHYIGSTSDLARRLIEHRRKHPFFWWNGQIFRRYATFLQALSRQYNPDTLAENRVSIMRQARRDNGSPLLMAINRAKIPWHVAAVWQADRQFDRNMHSRNDPHPGKMPNVDLLLKKHLPLLARIVASVHAALRARPKQEYSQHQAK